ncbi:MAG: hypothetical protein KDA25_06845 [Phycisphaerales bacterium]|nr:hypothetical protein [Phycisphaerales bacterium]
MSMPLRSVIAVVLVAIMFVALFGLLATFEPGAGHLAWRIGYGLVAGACLGGIVLVLWRRR